MPASPIEFSCRSRYVSEAKAPFRTASAKAVMPASPILFAPKANVLRDASTPLDSAAERAWRLASRILCILFWLSKFTKSSISRHESQNGGWRNFFRGSRCTFAMLLLRRSSFATSGSCPTPHAMSCSTMRCCSSSGSHAHIESAAPRLSPATGRKFRQRCPGKGMRRRCGRSRPENGCRTSNDLCRGLCGDVQRA